MVAFAKSEGGLAALAEEYHAFLSAYEQDRSIMRFRLSEYSTHRIGVVLGGIDLPERSFAAQPDFLRRCKMFITQDEIDRFFLAESADSRLDVYAFFCYPHTKEEQQKFIKKCFGEYSGGGCDGYDYMGVCLEGAVIVLACIVFSAFAASDTIVLGGGSVVTQVWGYLGEVIFNMLVLVGLVKGADRVVREMFGM